MTSLFDLTGKVAAVTGANTGLGQAMSVALAKAGASVALIGRSTPDKTVAMIDAFNGKHAVIMTDLSAAKSAEKAIDRAEEALGPIDILVNNAGIIRRGDALDFSEDDWDDVMAPMKDTAIVGPGEKVDFEFTADNPGHWFFHCHNLYHLASGMAREFRYRA